MLQAFYTLWPGETPPGWAGCLPAQYRATVSSAGAPAYLLLAAALVYTQGSAAALQHLQRGPHGKPVFALPGLHCSLSHSGSAAFCALGNAPCGADVQQAVPVKEGLAQYALGPQAAAWVQSHARPQAAFARAWALRESWLKYTGEGLAGLRRAPDICPGDPISGLPAGISCTCFELGAYHAAVCANEPCAAPVYISPQQCLAALAQLKK